MGANICLEMDKILVVGDEELNDHLDNRHKTLAGVGSKYDAPSTSIE